MKLFSFATIVFTIIKLCKNEDDFDNPIAFHMFEHHELTKEAFINEIELVYQLRQHRKNLENLYHKVLELTSENVKLEDKTTLDPLHALDILKKTSVKWPFLKRMMEVKNLIKILFLKKYPFNLLILAFMSEHYKRCQRFSPSTCKCN